MAAMADADPYTILGVAPDATPAAVRAAWKRLAATYHPDRFVTAAPDAQTRAAAHMIVINGAYEDIRSGRARSRPSARRPTASAQRGYRPPPFDPIWDDGPDEPRREAWIDPELLDAALRRAEQARQRQRRFSTSTKVAAALVGVVIVGLIVHLSMSQEYRYAYIWDDAGNTYADVECGDRYDSGKSTAAALRDRAVGSSSPGRLLDQAETVEEVCGQWRSDLKLLWLGVVPVGAYGAWWLVGRRRTW
jgi:curved DNA-binding protein CbpA